LTVRDYAKWRPVIDKAAPLRDKAGLKNAQVNDGADNPNAVLVWSETYHLGKARDALTGPDIQRAMKEAGVLGPPKIHIIP
jgi:erythromycin esterase-like protein